MELPSVLANVVFKAFELWTTPVFKFRLRPNRVLVEFMPKEEPHQSVDERIAKIEAARLNLTEALGAIDELKTAAEQNKAELAQALQTLCVTQAEKAIAERELQAVRQIAQNDVGAFQRLAGVQSKRDVARERFVGFLLGVIASVLASAVWWGLSMLLPMLKT